MLTIELKRNPETGVYEAILEGDGSEPTGKLEASGQVARFAEAEVLGIPFGKALVGAAGAGLGDIIAHFIEPFTRNLPVVGSSFTPGQRRALVLLAAAWAVRTDMGKKILSNEGSQAASMLLAVDALASVFNARSFVGNIAHGLGVGSHAGRPLGQEFNGNGSAVLTQAQGRVSVDDEVPARARLVGV
jgi:hypothetical protein